MIANPGGKRVIRHLAGRDSYHGRQQLGVGYAELVAVELEERFEQDRSDALVAIDERMVLDDPERVQRGQSRNVHGRVRRSMLRARER